MVSGMLVQNTLKFVGGKGEGGREGGKGERGRERRKGKGGREGRKGGEREGKGEGREGEGRGRERGMSCEKSLCGLFLIFFSFFLSFYLDICWDLEKFLLIWVIML